MKSCIELAKELDVSKQTVFNHARNLNIELVKVKNSLHISNENDENKIKLSIIGQKSFDDFDKAVNKFKRPVVKAFDDFDVNSRTAIDKMYEDLNGKDQKDSKDSVDDFDKLFDEFNNRIDDFDNALTKQIDALLKQRERDYEQMAEKDRQIERLSRLLENQQILALESHQKIRSLEEQLHGEVQEEKNKPETKKSDEKISRRISRAIFKKVFL